MHDALCLCVMCVCYASSCDVCMHGVYVMLCMLVYVMICYVCNVTYVCMYVCVCVYVRMYVWVYIFMYVCMNVCMPDDGDDDVCMMYVLVSVCMYVRCC